MKKKKKSNDKPKMPTKQQQKEWSTINQELVLELMECLRRSGFKQPVFDMVFTNDIMVLEPTEFVWKVVNSFIDSIILPASALGDYFFIRKVDEMDASETASLFTPAQAFQEGRKGLLAWVKDKNSVNLSLVCTQLSEGLRSYIKMNVNCYGVSTKKFQERNKEVLEKICSFWSDKEH